MQKSVLASCRGLFVAAAIMTLVFSTSVLAERPPTVLGGGESSTSAAAEKKHPGPQFYARTNYVWPYSAGPYYGLMSVSELERSKPGMLITAVGAIDVSLGVPSFPEELTTPNLLSKGGDSQFFVLVADPNALKDGDFGAELETLRSLGGEVIEEMPVASFLVRLNSEAHAALSGNRDVLALFPYHAAFKIDPSVGRVPLIDEQEATSELYRLRVSTFPGTNLDELKQQIIALGSTSVQLRSGSSLVFYLHRSKLAALAQLQSVKQIVEDVPLLIHGEESTATMQAGTCGSASSPCLSPLHDADITGGGRATCTGGSSTPPLGGPGALCQRNSDCNSNVCTRTVPAQTIAILDSGVQLDAADLSDTFSLPGTINDPNHRKVIVYESAAQFGGEGDLMGCDSSLSGGSTHGHVVAAVAAGNATDTFPGYGGASFLFTPPPDRNPWKVDGVAPGALIVAYDAQKTPAAGGSLCGSEINIGDLYIAGGGVDSALEGAYSEGARVVNMSFGTSGTSAAVYTAALSGSIDLFLADNRDAMTFASAGNAGGDSNMDGVPDQRNVGEPAVAKNGVAVGASLNTGSGVNTRAGFSSVGPATLSSGRIAPLLMAPGSDSIAGPGLFDPYACRTNTNESTGPVVCLADEQIVIEEGTSFSSPAVAGAAALIRDYFGQGFYPDGVRKTANQEPVISGALVKAILITSAEFMTNIGVGGTLTEGGRFNFEQGYGRPELDNALPLQSWPPSPSGLVVTDGSVKVCDNAPTTKCTSSANCGGQPCNIPIATTSLTGSIGQGLTQTYTFKVEDNTQPLSIALVWIDPGATETLQNDVDLSLTSPGGKVYKGNFFSEDVNLSDVLDTAAGNVENCINGYDGTGAAGLIDEGAFSIATGSCGTITGVDRFDHKNPTEAIYLSHDANGDSVTCFAENRCPPGGDDPDTGAINEADDNQIEVGSWTLRIIAETTFAVGTGQDYSIALVGPVAARSSARFDDFEYVCNDLATVTVNETDPAADSDMDLSACVNNACRESEVESRTTVTVVDPANTVVDSETGTVLDFIQSGSTLSFVSGNNLVTDATLRNASSTYNNGVLDVRSGDTLRVVYHDEVNSVNTADLDRENQAAAVCKVKLRFGGVNFGQFGQNQATLIEGGCERDARGKFTFGRPDRYMDSDEDIGYRIAFTSAETDVTLDNVELSLRCVIADTNSPKTCQPGSTPTLACPDPDRLDNTTCTQMTIVDSPKFVEALPPGAVLAANFAVAMNTFSGTPDVDMMLGVTAETAGKTVQNSIASRHKLNRDEKSLFYSTDFPQGGRETVDYNNDEVITTTSGCVAGTPCLETARGEPTTNVDFLKDYRFEDWQWSNLEANSQNQFLQAPWDFDSNNGGFSVVVMADSDTELIAAGGAPAQWGEDFNGNGVLDKVCSGTQGGVLACTSNGQCGRCATFGLCQRISNQQILDIGCPIGCSGTACGCGGIGFQCIPMSCSIDSDCARLGGGSCDLAFLTLPGHCSDPPNEACSTNDENFTTGCPGGCSNNPATECATVGEANCGMGNLCNNPLPANNNCIAETEVDLCINGSEDRDSLNGLVDSGWSTRGGCGWQSKAVGATTGGIWHTGRIDFTTLTNCGTLGDLTGQCQLYETIGTTVSNDKKLWFELLKTPVMFKVNQGLSGGEPIYTSEHLQWAWNLAMDINDRTAGFSWELDLDTADIVSSNLDRLPVFNALFGEHGPRSGGNSPLTNGYLAFAPAHVCNNSLDGTPVACGTDEECDDLLLSGTCSVAASNICARAPNIACTNTAPDTAGAPQEVDAACDGVCNAPSCNDGGVEANCLCDTDFDCVGANGGPGPGPDPDGPGVGQPALPPLCNKLGPTGRGGVGPCVSSLKCSQSFYPCTTDDECRCVQNPGAGGNGGVGTRGDTVNGSSAALAPPGVCKFDNLDLCTVNGDCSGGATGPCVTRGNRGGKNSCFFEEPGAVVIPFNLPQPPDDDENNDKHCENDPVGTRNFCRVDNDCGACQNNAPFFCRVDDDCGSCTNNAAIPCQNQSDCASVGGGCNLAGAGTACTLAAASTACIGAADGTDEYVYPNGTIRTWDLSQVNGQDMRLGTLEDIYGDSGNSFQGGLGMLTFQGTGNVLEPGAGYGLGVDDMVVQWREYLLSEDETSCTPVDASPFDTGGTCASIELDTTQLYVGGAILGVSIIDPFPYDSVPDGSSQNYNDCDNDGAYTDAGTCSIGGAACDPEAGADPCQPSNGFCVGADDRDCNNNGINDIIATGTSTSLDLEILTLDLVSPGVYRTQFPVSVTYDVPGTLFLASQGAANPTAIVRYTDRDDGTGNKCPNSTDPTTEGIVDAITAVGITQADVIVTGSALTDALRDDCDGVPGGGVVACGDGDSFPDTNEILNLRLDITNKGSVDYEDVVVRVLSTSPNIDCILQPMAILGTLPKRGTSGKCDDNTTTCTGPIPTCNGIGDGSCNGAATAYGVGPFVFKVANLSRTSTSQDFSSTIKVLISSKDFNALLRPQEILFEMDLNASGGGGSQQFLQQFEGSLGLFTPDTDDNLAPNNEGSDGWRCQYNDPDNPQANSLDNPNCFLGFAGVTSSNFWHLHTTASADGGKAHGGNSSMHFGKHSGGITANDTEPLKQVDSAVSTPVHLGFGSPKLEFWHIVSLMDYRGSNTPAPYSIDAAVVQVQRWDNGLNQPIGNWIKIAPYQNVYDVQRTDIFSNCSFDPVNDGNNEDAKFDPTDPQEIHGPASTCNPEFNFVALGDSHPTRAFNALLTGRASDPDPEFIAASSTGNGGTWVQSRFDLSRFRGRSVRLRFLATTSEIEDNQDWVDAGFAAGSLIDDGWYVDDVLIQEALSAPPTLAVDAAANTAFPGCGAGCISVTPVLEVNPPTATSTGVGPGQTVELNAAGSSANQCADGTVHFRFWEDLDASLTFSAGDTLLRDFTDNPIAIVGPNVSTTYGVDVKCTSSVSVSCNQVVTADVIVNCPQTSTLISGNFPVSVVGALNAGVKRIQWTGLRYVDALRGDLIALRAAAGNFNGPVQGCPRNNVLTNFINFTTDPVVGGAFFFLVRDEDITYCNHVGSYSESATPPEEAGRDAEVNADPQACAP